MVNKTSLSLSLSLREDTRISKIPERKGERERKREREREREKE
jgi:hypothetical protein